MGLDSTAAKSVSVTAQIGQVSIPINAITLINTVDEAPQATFTTQLMNSASAQLGSAHIDLGIYAALNRSIQEFILNKFTVTPNLKIVVTDGDGVSIKFEGFVGRPETDILEGGLSIRMTGIQQVAALQCLNGNIYTDQHLYSFPEDIGFLPIQEPNLVGVTSGFGANVALALDQIPSIAKRLSIILRSLASNYQANRDIANAQFQSSPIKDLNLKALDPVLKFLSNSEQLTSFDAIADPAFMQHNLYLSLYSALVDSPDFYQAVQVYLRMFLFQMTCDWSADTAKMEYLRVLDDPGNNAIEVPVASATFNLAHMHEVPIIQAIVQGNGSELYGVTGGMLGTTVPQPTFTPVIAEQDIHSAIEEAKSLGDTSLKTIGRWPQTLPAGTSGAIRVIRAPSWINQDKITPTELEDPLSLALASSLGAIDSLSARLGIIQDKLVASGQIRKSLCDILAEFAFKDVFLRGVMASVSCPLCLGVKVGRTYTVTDTTGKEVLVGYLKSVQHRISVIQDGAEAMTTMTFSHVRAPGVQLSVLTNGKLYAFDKNTGTQHA